MCQAVRDLSLPCPCGSGVALQDCCGPYVLGGANAPTAEALMRSRYTAFTLGEVDYLIATHHPTQRHPAQRQQISGSIQNTTWLGLRVLQAQQGQAADHQGQVEFIAYYQDPKPGQIHERSRFLKQRDRWFYVDGDQLPPILPRRNDPCWCGSGKRYKGCHD